MWSQSSVGVWNDVTECLTLFPLRNWMIGEGDRSYINVQEKEYSSIVTWSFESGINISAVAEVAVSGIRKSWVIIASSISHWMFPKCEYIKCKRWSYSLVCNRFWMVSVWSLSSVRLWKMSQNGIVIPSQKLNDWRGRPIIYCRSSKYRNNHQNSSNQIVTRTTSRQRPTSSPGSVLAWSNYRY